MEFIIGEVEVCSRQARVIVRTVPNISSDRWFSIKILLEFPEDLFNGIEVESKLGEAEVWSRQSRVIVQTVHNI